MKMKLKEIADLVDGEIVGDENILISGISGIKEAQKGDITFVANSKYLPLMESTKAAAIITFKNINSASRPIIKCENPSLAFAKLVSAIAPNKTYHPKGISKNAIIGKNVKLGKDVSIQAYVVVEDNAEIEDGATIYSGVYIGHHTRIGKNTVIYPSVSIRERVKIGNNVIIHSGTVIGSDGFGFATVKGVHHKIPQIGTVEIGDNVEIGANVTIDRARFDKTVIGEGTKIDNLVQIAHNVIIGEHSIVVAQTGISGSTTVGKDVILAGQSGIAGHINIGNGAIIAAQAGATKSVPPGAKVSGYPAKPHNQAKRVNACIQRLPDLFRKVRALKKKVEKLEKENNKLKTTLK
jgi:UDP-3-O-[3-hydroxymyristoyl] glucosamine N-acyltransferase